MPNLYEMKKRILEMQEELAALNDAYTLERARAKAAHAQAMAEKAAQEARDMENVLKSRARKRAQRLQAALENI